MNVGEPPAVKIKIGTAIFGSLEYSCDYAMLQPEFINLRINRDEGVMSLQLSFKHIHRVEVLDNNEDKGAGMVLHINSFMAQRIQSTLNDQSKAFVDFRTPYASNSIIIVDILSADQRRMQRVKDMLLFCAQFHRHYVISQRLQNKAPATDKQREPVLSVTYCQIMGFNQWKTLLGFYNKHIVFETAEMRLSDTHKPSKFTIGRIVRPDVYSLQADGRLVAVHRQENGSSRPSPSVVQPYNNYSRQTLEPILKPHSSKHAIVGEQRSHPIRHVLNPGPSAQTLTRPVAAVHEPPSSNGSIATPGTSNAIGNFGSMTPSSFPSPLSPGDVGPPATSHAVSGIPMPLVNGNGRSVTQKTTRKREVHVIEDEEEEPTSSDPSTSKKNNDTIFVYPPSGPHGCSVHYADLKFLDYSYMLNDTIIDFYLKYVYYELLPPETRKRIFMFNSFFYSRISQPPSNKPYVAAHNRWKRVQPNFQFVKSWTKKVNLFDMDHVIVPINEDIHWYLAVIVNPRQGITNANVNGHQKQINRDKQRRGGPFVVVLDSLIESERKHSVVRDILAEYLSLEYADKRASMKLPGQAFDKTSVRLVTPSGTPQQKNFVDCGVFLLNFAEIFMKNPPTITSTCVSFRAWYPNFRIKGKRDEVKSIIRRLAAHVKYADFLPPNATPTLMQKGKKRLPQLPIDLVPTIRPRRHSESSVSHYEKETHFTSLDLSGMSRSLDSIIEQLRDMPPIVITVQEVRKRGKKSPLSNIVGSSPLDTIATF